MSVPAIMGISAGVVDFLSFIPYILSIVKGKTKPERASFAIWCGVTSIVLISYFASGARDTIWFVLTYSVMEFVVFALSFKFGMGGFNKLDVVCIVVALIGLGAWAITKNPLTALYINIAVETIGFIPTYKKIYYLPETENTLAWSMATVASVLNIFAVTAWNLHIALYPVLTLLLDGSVVVLLLVPRRKPKQSREELYKKLS